MSRGSALAVMLTATLSLFAVHSQASADDSAREKQSDTPAVGTAAYVQKALGKPVDLKLMDASLEAVVKELGKQVSLTIHIDDRALEEVGMDASDLKISKALNGLSLRSVLRNVLRELDLTYMYYEGVLMITTPEMAEGNLVTTIYEVVDLIGTDESRPEEFDYDTLIELITTTVHPESWDEVGGPGSISGYRGALVLSQTVEVHEDIAQLLAAARKAKKISAEHRDKAPPVVSIPLSAVGKVDENAAIEKALNKTVEFEFKEVSLDKAVRTLSKNLETAIEISERSLDEAGIGKDTPITISVRNLKLRQALRLMLRELDLAYYVTDGVLIISTPEYCEQNQITRAYPIMDLVDVGSPAFGLPAGHSTSQYDYDRLIELTTSAISPDTWDEVGGPGSLAVMGAYGFFVITQTYEVHEQIEQFYTTLRQTIPDKGKKVAEKKDDGRVRLAVYVVPSNGPKEKKPQTNKSDEKTEAKGKTLQQYGGGCLGGFGGGGGGFGGVEPRVIYGPAPDEEETLELITTLIEPESWSERDDVFARAVTGRLVIRHTESVHRQIKELAARLGIPNFREVPNWQTNPNVPQGGGFF
jgi:hypothetical protein